MTQPPDHLPTRPPGPSALDEVAALEAELAGDDGGGHEDAGEPGIDATAPPEVVRDVMEELRGYDQPMPDQRQALPPLPAFDNMNFDMGYGLSHGAPAIQPLPRGDRRQGGAPAFQPIEQPLSSGRLSTLEELYSAYQQLFASDNFELYIERKSPAAYKNLPCKGWVDTINETLSTREFGRRYGGGRYVVRLLERDLSKMGAGDEYHMRPKTHVEFDVSGAPVMPATEQEGMTSAGSRFMGHGADDAQVQRRRLEIEAQERRDVESRVDKLQRELRDAERSHGDPSWIRTVNEIATERTTEVMSLAQSQLGSMRVANEKLQASLSAREAELAKLRAEHAGEITQLKEESYRMRTEHATALHTHESEKLREQRERFEGERRALVEAEQRDSQRLEALHRTEIQRLRDDHEAKMTEVTRQHDRTLRDMMERSTTDRAGQREIYESRLSQMQQSYESRISQMQQDKQDAISQVREMMNSNIESVKVSAASAEKSAHAIAKVQVESAIARAERLEMEVEASRREAEEARRRADQMLAETRQSPMEAWKSAKEMVDTFGGGPQGPQTWQDKLAEGLLTAARSAPEIAAKISETRQQNQQQRAALAAQHQAMQHAQAMQQHQQQQHAALGPPPMAPQMQQQQQGRRQRVHRAPPPGMGVPEAGGSMSAVPIGGEGPVRHSAVPISGFSSPNTIPLPTAPFVPGFMEPAMATTRPDPPAEPPPGMAFQPTDPSAGPVQWVPLPQPPAAPAGPSPAPPPAGGGLATLPAEQVTRFIGMLESAIKTPGMLPVETFAEGVVQEMGPEIARELLVQFPADAFIEMVAKGGGHESVLVTRDGRKYVRALWARVGELVGGA